MTYIKLTREDGTTRNNMPWAVGLTNRATGRGRRLCSDGVLHVYDTPEQAAFMRHRHCLDYTRAWEVRSRCKGVTDGTKRGIKSCAVVREIQLPEITLDQRIKIGIRASLLVYTEDSYVKWATQWLSGETRSRGAAIAAFHKADDATYAAYAEANAAYDAANAARAAAFAAVEASNAPAYAAYNAARAAAYAKAYAPGCVDLQSIIKEVLG